MFYLWSPQISLKRKRSKKGWVPSQKLCPISDAWRSAQGVYNTCTSPASSLEYLGLKKSLSRSFFWTLGKHHISKDRYLMSSPYKFHTFPHGKGIIKEASVNNWETCGIQFFDGDLEWCCLLLNCNTAVILEYFLLLFRIAINFEQLW